MKLTQSQRKAINKYRKTSKGKAANKRYRTSEKGKEAQRKATKKYRNKLKKTILTPV